MRAILLFCLLLPAVAEASQTRLFALDPEFLLVPDASDVRLFPAVFAESGRGAWFEPSFYGIGGGRPEREAAGFFSFAGHPAGLYFADRASTALDLGIAMFAEGDVVTATPRGNQGHAWRPKLSLGATLRPVRRVVSETGLEWSWFLERQTIAGVRWDAGVLSATDSSRRPSYGLRERLTAKVTDKVSVVAAGWYEWNDLSETATWGVIQPSGLNIVYRVVFTDLAERKGASAGVSFVPMDGVTAYAGCAFQRTRLHRSRDLQFFQYAPMNGASKTMEFVFPAASVEASVSEHWILRAGFSTRATHVLSDGLTGSFSPYTYSAHQDDLSWIRDGGAGVGYHQGTFSADLAITPGQRHPQLAGAARIEF